jgi:mediator of RNA polymerase II transcription subunit 17
VLTGVRWAKFAASNTVDLISLILSVDPNKRSLTHFSHTFKTQGLEQGLPFGSFGVSKENHSRHHYKTEEKVNNAEYEQRQELVSKGSRMAALDVATDDILKAARKLEKEVRRETKYWQEIVSISDKGWPIQRLRQTQNMRNVPFAVRYGHPEGRIWFDYITLMSELTFVQLATISRLAVSHHSAWIRMAASYSIPRWH